MPPLRHRLSVLAAARIVAASAQAGTILSQTFDDASALPTEGWLVINANPDPTYKLDWFQGNPDVFIAHGGPDGGYVASTWGATAAGAQLANWLITPEFSTAGAGTVMFWLRGADAAGRPLLYTPNPFVDGSSVSHWDVSAFPNLLMEPNITLDLTTSLVPPKDLTKPLLTDLGW